MGLIQQNIWIEELRRCSFFNANPLKLAPGLSIILHNKIETCPNNSSLSLNSQAWFCLLIFACRCWFSHCCVNHFSNFSFIIWFYSDLYPINIITSPLLANFKSRSICCSQEEVLLKKLNVLIIAKFCQWQFTKNNQTGSKVVSFPFCTDSWKHAISSNTQAEHDII